MKVEENVIKWKKMVVDVQNKVFYRRSIRFYGDSYRRSIGLQSIINSIMWRRSIRFYGDFMEKINKIMWRRSIELLETL